jgi:hypothetical protein
MFLKKALLSSENKRISGLSGEIIEGCLKINNSLLIEFKMNVYICNRNYMKTCLLFSLFRSHIF